MNVGLVFVLNTEEKAKAQEVVIVPVTNFNKASDYAHLLTTCQYICYPYLPHDIWTSCWVGEISISFQCINFLVLVK